MVECRGENFKILDLQRLSSPGIMIEMLMGQIYLVQTPQGKLLHQHNNLIIMLVKQITIMW